MTWKRPESLSGNRVWRRFKGKGRNGQPAKMYQIRDMEESIKEKCIELMEKTFIRDEPLCKALDLSSDMETIAAIKKNWNILLSQNISLACYTEDDGEPDELVGFNVLMVKCKDDEEEIREFPNENYVKLIKTLETAEQLINVFDYYGVDMYLTSSGLTVLPEHRGQNIGAEIFAAREPLCKALGIKVVCTVFTAITSQILAGKCGYQQLAELPYEDMKIYGVNVDGIETPSAKVMAIKFQ